MKATLELPAAPPAPPAERVDPVQANPLVLAIPAMLLAFLLIFPFLNKAFAIDDPIYLLESSHAMRDFWHPLRFDLCWLAENVCAPAPRLIPNVALIAWFLLPASWLGTPEWLVHLMQFGALCLAIAATVSIAIRLGCDRVEAAFAGLLVATFPPVLAYTNGATPDTLAMALGAAGIERLLLWQQERRGSAGALAGVFLGLAPLARPHLLLLVPIAALALLVRRRIRLLWPVALSLLVFSIGFLLARDSGGDVPVVPQTFLAVRNIVYNAFSYCWYLIVPFPLGIAWMIGAGRRGAALLALAIALFLVLVIPGYISVWVALIVVGAGCGAFALLATAGEGIRERSAKLLLLAAWSAIPLATLSYVHLPPKYLMSGAPAIAILMVLFLQKRRLFTPILCTLLAGCVGLSWLTLRADAEFAGKARVAAADLIRPETTAGRNVWFTGEWGIYWYAQRAGARVLTPTGPQPMAGDLLLVGAEGPASNLAQRFLHRTLLARREYVSTFGRTMNHKAGAGLHSNVVGPFIWVPSNGYMDSYDLWRID